jgi:hypothetical protein
VVGSYVRPGAPLHDFLVFETVFGGFAQAPTHSVTPSRTILPNEFGSFCSFPQS